MAGPGLPAKDVDPLPGPAFSYGKGEPIPAGMPSADANTSPNNVFPSTSDPGAMFHGYAAATRQMGEINRQQGIETEKLLGEQEAQSKKAVQLAEEAFKKSGYIPDELKHGWNVEEQTKKFTTDPIEAFGSLGSVLGILASSFTHAPLINSMDASAAAMNAYKAADKENYNRAFKAWQENTKLFLDRHKLEREHMQDAITLLKTNMAAGEQKMRMVAARFNNQKLQVLFDNGMWKEGLEYIDAYNTAAEKMAKTQKTAMDLGAERGMFLEFGGDPKDMSSPKSVAAWQKLEVWKAHVKQMEHSYGTASLTKEDAQELQRRVDQYKAEGMSQNEAYDKARTEIAAAAAKPNRGVSYIKPDQAITGFKTLLGHDLPPEANDLITSAYTASPSKRASLIGKVSEARDELVQQLQNGPVDDATVTRIIRDKLQSADVSGAPTKEKAIARAAQEIVKKNPGIDIEAATKMATERETLERSVPKAFTASQRAQLTDGPGVVAKLRAMDALMTGDWYSAVGVLSGAIKEVMAKYANANDVAGAWHILHQQVEADLPLITQEMGQRSKLLLEEQLKTIPSAYKSDAYSKKQLRALIQTTTDRLESQLSIMQVERKTVPPDILKKFNDVGIFTADTASKNPLLQLRSDPTTMTDETLDRLSRQGATLSKEDRALLLKELERRNAGKP